MLDKGIRVRALRQARPLQFTKPIRNLLVLIGGIVDDDRNQEQLFAVIRWLRSTASFHSSRKYPSSRACVFFEITGMNSAQLLICLRID
jgi:hypothetical protein